MDFKQDWDWKCWKFFRNLRFVYTFSLICLQLLIQLVAYFFQPQLIFTCYIRANLGPGHIEWLREYIHFDERIFSIVIGFLRICADRSLIHSTYMGEEKIKWKKLPGKLLIQFTTKHIFIDIKILKPYFQVTSTYHS